MKTGRTMRWAWLAACTLLCSLPAWAASVRGQIYMPSGQIAMKIIQFTLESDDPRRQPEIRWTDTNGKFIIEGLAPGTLYRIVVRGDGVLYADTTHSFVPQSEPWIPVNLNAVAGTKTDAPPTVTVQELKGSAKSEYDKAKKAIQNGKSDEARKRLQKVIELDPSYGRAYNDLAVLNMTERKYAEAEKLLRSAIEKDSKAIQPYYNLGLTLNRLGRYKEALEPLRTALKEQPKWHNAEAQLGIALLESEQLDAARPCLEAGTQAEGSDLAYAYLYLGKLYAAAGENGQAVVAWDKYLEVDPKSANADQVRGLLQQIRPRAEKVKMPLATASKPCQ